MNPTFFIGWNPNMPERNKKALRLFLIPLFLLLPVGIYLIVSLETPFNDHHFELGTIREFNGVYFNDPQPLLVLNEAHVPAGYDREALLVGYGKFGAASTMAQAMERTGPLQGREIRLRGTLLYGDEKIVIELTEGEASVLGEPSRHMHPVQMTKPKPIRLQGEIIDPKCWFGAMKPGEGKVHKSCAIRCISGGIPPVLKIEQNKMNLYYLLEGIEDEPLNETLLEFVAEPIEVSGNTYYQNGWNVLQTSAKNIRYIN